MEHVIESLENGTKRCPTCSKVFTRGVWGDCPGVTQYEWGKGQEGLFTERQLRAMGLIPGKVAGALYYSKSPDGWLWLYRKDDATAKPPLSEKQQSALTKMQAAALASRTCQRCGVVYGRKNDLHNGRCSKCVVAQWCTESLDEECLILDVETTGLDGSAEIVSISIIDHNGNVRLSTYVKPIKPINEHGRAYAVNGISNAMVANAPRFGEIYPFIEWVTRNKTIIAYNSDFDEGMIETHLKRYSLPALHNVEWYCLMTWFATGYGRYNYRRRRHDWVSLVDACRYMDVDHTAPHEAVGDCQASLRLLRALATWKPVDTAAEIREGLKQALEGDTRPIETLWTEFNKDE